MPRILQLSTRRPAGRPVSGRVAEIAKPDSPRPEGPIRKAAAGGHSSLADLNLDDLAERGRIRLEEAEKQAETILREAEEAAAGIHEEAKQRGYRAGEAAAADDIEARVQRRAKELSTQSLGRLEKMVADIASAESRYLHDYADRLGRLIVDAVQTVCGKAFAADPEILLRWAADAIAQVHAGRSVRIVVNPETLAVLAAPLETLVTAGGSGMDIQIVPSEDVAPSDLIIRQEGGEVRAGLDDQISELARLLDTFVPVAGSSSIADASNDGSRNRGSSNDDSVPAERSP